MPTATWFRLPTARRLAVEAAAEAEFGARGFSRGSLNVIARDAGVSKGSLFQYFQDKDELCAHLSDLVCSRIRAEVTELITPLPWQTDFFGALSTSFQLWMHYYANHPAELAFTSAINLEPDPTTQPRIRAAANRHYLEVFRPLLAKAVAAGQLGRDADVEAFLALLMLLLPHLAIAPSHPGLDAVFGLAERHPADPFDEVAARRVADRLVAAFRTGFGPR